LFALGLLIGGKSGKKFKKIERFICQGHFPPLKEKPRREIPFAGKQTNKKK